MKLCFASNNENKLAEASVLLQGHEVVSLRRAGCHQALAEDRNTIEGNSEQKAQFVFETFGVSCFADDTGLEVEALNGAPGVYSARYAGTDCNDENNIDFLLKNLEGAEQRQAQFRTVITLVTSEVNRQFEGVLKGIIADRRKGNNGFGYDSIFIPNGKTATLAEMTASDKNRISHRGIALRKMAKFIAAEFSEKSEKRLTMKEWSPADQPREKMLLKGVRELSDAELIAVLFRSGTPTMNAVELAKQILSHARNDLARLGSLSLKEMQRIKGVGLVKSTAIAAALELGRRRRETVEAEETPPLISSRSAYNYIKDDLLDLQQEEFWVLILNHAKRLTAKRRVSQGGINFTLVDPRIVFRHAVDASASSIIVAHNHPSGTLRPSDSDIRLTKRLKDAGQLLDIKLDDHLIIAHHTYFSFSDEGLL